MSAQTASALPSFVHLHAPDARPGSDDWVFAICADQLLAAKDVTQAVRLPRWSELPPVDWHAVQPLHVGLLGGHACWALSFDPSHPGIPPDLHWHETRALLGVLTPEQLQGVSCARQLLWWRQRHRYCGVCGTATVPIVEERAVRCPHCSAVFFPVASAAVIVAVTRADTLLLAHNRNFHPAMFSVLAGFVDPGESLEQAVQREVQEEVGIQVGNIRYVASQPWSFPNSLMLAFRAEHVAGELKVDGREIELAGWYRRDQLPQIPRIGTVARLLIDHWLAESR